MRSTVIAILLASAFLASASALADSVLNCETRRDRPAETKLETEHIRKIAPLRSCEKEIDKRTACNIFLARALRILFDNTDFEAGGSPMLANDIANGLEQPGNVGWTKIGNASDQAALDRAQKLANERRPVIAARLGALKPSGDRGAGHVALILPGTAQTRNFDNHNWKVLATPNTASFFLDQPERFFAGCPLSAVWRKPTDVGLYAKQ